MVVYDYLANPQLSAACADAELIYVGKKAAQHSMTQEQIDSLLVEKGKAGLRVVRLKGGDPYVFGRGGEEESERKQIPGYRARRWVVERTHSWFGRFRRLLIRREKKVASYVAFLDFACAWVTFCAAGILG